MLRRRMFDLEKRVSLADDLVDSLEKARGFDLSARVSMRFPMERVLVTLSPFFRRGSQVLLVGSQTGLLPLILGGCSPQTEFFGIEENPYLHQVAEENLALAVLARSPARVEFRCASMTDLPVDDREADLVISYLPLHRCSDPVKFFRECHRVCKTDGLVFIYDMARDAEEGIISFILQYVSVGHEEFMASLRASYTTVEVQDFLEKAGLGHWPIARESLNLRVTSKEMTACP
jgi:SAM-dependent methyltransferase